MIDDSSSCIKKKSKNDIRDVYNVQDEVAGRITTSVDIVGDKRNFIRKRVTRVKLANKNKHERTHRLISVSKFKTPFITARSRLYAYNNLERITQYNKYIHLIFDSKTSVRFT